MPSERFLKLSEVKRMRIIGAAVCEFSKAPVNEVPISSIIKAANIPRGSFYQYFEDKNDLLRYILDEFKQRVKDGFTIHAKNCQDNLFTMAKMAFEAAAAAAECENIDLIRNFFLSLKLSNGSFWNLFKEFGFDFDFLRLRLREIAENTKLLRLDDDYIENVVNILALIIGKNLADLFSDFDNADTYKNHFYSQLDIIMLGSIKQSDN